MTRFILLTILFLSGYRVSGNKDEPRLEPERIAIYSYMTAFQKIDEALYTRHLYDTVYINYSGNMVIYQLPYQVLDVNAEDGGPRKVKFNYFVFRKSEKRGLFFKDTSDAFLPKSAGVDSLIKTKGHATVVQEKGVKKISSIRNEKEKTMIEWYLPENKKSEFTFDTAILRYNDHLINSNYSIGPALDSSRKSKLCGFSLVFNAYYSESQKMQIPAKKVNISFSRLPFTNNDKILVARLRELYNKNRDVMLTRH